jgi:cell division protein FtsB
MDRRVNPSAARSAPASFGEQFKDFLNRNITWLLVAGLALLIIQDVFGNHGVLAMRHSLEQAAAMRKQISDLNQENQKLQDTVKSLKSDPTAIERIARQEMGLARPGEFVFKTQPDEDDSKQTPPPSSSTTKRPAP